jgi:hypothetical protein
MKKEILEIITQHKYDHISSEQAVTELLRLFNVSGEVCDNCREGKPVICAKCYEIESNFRESY